MRTSESNNDICQAEWYMGRVFSAYLFCLVMIAKICVLLLSSPNQNMGHGPLFNIRSWRNYTPLIARFMGPTWGPSGADRTQVGPMLAPLALLSRTICRPMFLCVKLHSVASAHQNDKLNYSDVIMSVSNHRRLDCLLSRLLRHKANIKAPRPVNFAHKLVLSKCIQSWRRWFETPSRPL